MIGTMVSSFPALQRTRRRIAGAGGALREVENPRS
jgi:hypothetical protein